MPNTAIGTPATKEAPAAWVQSSYPVLSFGQCPFASVSSVQVQMGEQGILRDPSSLEEQVGMSAAE